MTHKNIYELAEEIRRELHEIVDQRVDDFILRMENGNTETVQEMELPLTTMPAYFKGKKPVSIVYPDGTEVAAPTWKKVATQLLQNCAEDEVMHGRLKRIRGKVFGRDRLLFSDSGEGMNVPLEIEPDMYLEGKFDTEALLKVITTRIFAPIGYDYSSIHLKIIDPALSVLAEEPSTKTEMDDLEEPLSEDEGFCPMM